MRRATVLGLLGLFALSLLVPRAHAQNAAAADSAAPAFRASFRWAPLVPPSLPALAPGGIYGPRVPPALVAAAWVERVRASIPPPFASRDTVLPRAAPRPALTPEPPRVFEGPRTGVGAYVELGMELNVRFELKADQFRNLRCSAFDRQLAASGCNPGFPTISPNPQYAVRTRGVVGQRLHVDVDFDSQREFDANNNLQIWYEGLEDEPLRRVEAGNVTFQMPSSRFISAAIPANNFGVQAVAQFGPLELRGIYAEQRGSVVHDRVYTIGEFTTQPLDREARDLDYEQGRFFFTIDPAAIPAFPAVDILAVDPAALPDSLRVGGLRVYRVRALSAGGGGNENIGGVRAVACGAAAQSVACTAQRAGPFQWEILVEGRDYYVDASGAWLALASRLDQADYLAVSYVTQSGLDSVGTFPATAGDAGAVDTLRLVYDPRPGVTAAAPAFRFEVRNAYRVGGREVERQSVALTLTVNQRERTLTGQTYLERLGIAVASDPNRFDQYNRLFPRERDPQQGAPVRDQFVVFPHLTPFADQARLEATERNDSLYRTPRTALSTQGPPSVFALRVRADASASADRSVLALNSFQIREGSERLVLGSRLLERGRDYVIDYATGQVQFLSPDSLFQGGAAQVRAQFEERSAFAVAPTSIVGLAARYDLGTYGQVNVTGLFQSEQSTFTRPPLGFEPSSGFIGGVSTRLRFEPAWLTRAVDALPAVRTDAPSFITVAAEVAVSKPSPNRFGRAYIEEFEAEGGRFISLDEKRWHWGSRPCGDPRAGCAEGARGAEPFGISPAGFAVGNAAALTWQNLPYNSDGTPVQFFPQQIDPTIRIAGQAQSAEPALWLMLKPDTVLGLANDNPASPGYGSPNWVRPPEDAPRWRSITLGLSETGIDLSRVEFLELWVWEDQRRVARANRAVVLFDFGSVFEDAVALVPDSYQVLGGDTTYSGARLAGQGRLDTERDPVTRTWNADLHDTGILTDRVVDGITDLNANQVRETLPLCNASAGGALRQFAFGDLRSRCGRRNGAVDAEDLDGDFLLDSLAGARLREDFVRFVFPLGDERYFVRDGGMVPARDPQGNVIGASGWRLYRIPFRTDTLQIGQPNLRQVQALRVTIVAPQTTPPGEPDPQLFFGLTRVRLVGSSWLKRADTPIRGIAGDRGTGTGEVVASVVSTENRDLGYTPPPGVSDEADRRDAALQVGTTQINEKSLQILARGLAAGEHAEAFVRFTAAGDKNFLKYRELRVWARGRGPGWEDGDLEFYIKAGKDPDNFYLYRTRARTASWEPEVVVQFDRWLVLRAAVEQAWLRGDTAQVYSGCPDQALIPHDSSYVMCDGPYIAHIRNPGTSPPNLASVQELAAGVLRVADRVFVDQAEVWVDDIRLGGVVQDAGVAGALDVSVAAANVADVAVSLYRRDGNFRQLGEDPSYVTDNSATTTGTVRLERFLPAGWGIAAPFTVRHTNGASQPVFLNRTDLTASALAGLRTPRSQATSYAVSLRRTRRAAGPLGRLLLDPVGLSANYAAGDSRSDLSQAVSSSYGLNLDYALQPGPLRGLGLRVNPTALRFRSGLSASDAERRVYQVMVARPSDTLAIPVRSESHVWRNSLGADFLPLAGVQLRLDLASLRDLRDYGDSTTAGRVIRQSRRGLLGQDVGIEAQRSLATSLSVAPNLVRWARPRMQLTSTFSLTRDPNARQLVRDVGDSAGAFRLPTAFSSSRRSELGLQVDPARFGQAAFADSGWLARALARLTQVDVTVARTINSSFSRSPLAPALGFQLGLGDLDRFRREGDVLATSASQNTNLAGQTALLLPAGLRINATYQRAQTETWVLRGAVQTPIRTSSLDWPAFTGAWTASLPRTGPGRILTSFTAQLGYRRRDTESRQVAFGGGEAAGGGTRSSSTDRSVAPSLSLTWVGGVSTSYDASTSRSEVINAGNVFRTNRSAQNANVNVSFRAPRGLVRLRAPVRGSLRYATNRSLVCLQAAGQATCVPYADSRRAQAELTLDTDVPPNISAGFQMAYVLNEERQANRKNAQLVLTVFVSLTTSVGQVR